jgi:hypothetical protein
MSVQMAIWKMTDDGPRPVPFSQLGLEKRLEDMIVRDTSLLGMDLLVVGRQVATRYGGFVDILAADSDGHLHVLELKRDRTPREVVAQVLDYGSWVQGLTLEDVSAIYGAQHTDEFTEAFAARFDAPVPDVFNPAQQLTIVASQLDDASDRIVTFLAESFSVPLNAVFFRYFTDGGSEFLARTWLLAPEEAETKRGQGGARTKVRSWNGQDFYVVQGNVEAGGDRWAIGSKYGFVGAGGGSWYSKPLRNLSVGKRVFAYVGGAGYVGVGEVTGTVIPLRDLVVTVDGKTLRVVEQHDVSDAIRTGALADDEDMQEYAVPIRWLESRHIDKAVTERGLFASQVTVCKLRDDRTIEVVLEAFGLQDE